MRLPTTKRGWAGLVLHLGLLIGIGIAGQRYRAWGRHCRERAANCEWRARLVERYGDGPECLRVSEALKARARKHRMAAVFSWISMEGDRPRPE
jgi:hypothetical protein